MLSEEGISGVKFLLITVSAGIFFLWLCCVFIVVSGLSNCPSVWGS